ncbi:hypothetical protein [Candidatus Synechococcus spongiarum]|uniref:Uncharacterized protein n=1 Tax=Candidatus Synechococcus spongiarum LMB bulk15N TaxID=1943583 RepID=A0A1T1D5P6_9SYNE|nr:hypothetical protein [Candidatus Synechococcus spongiarum]MCY4360239.1 hypothetical protein [Cyanobacteria bacterium MAG APA_bin_95]OOV36189.1 hypothetical protein BV53_01655 [Candidatus Synechococcus spongiarum LMB bulk15N]
MRWRTLLFPWIGLALTTVLLLKLLAVVVGTRGGEPGALRGALAFTVHDHGPMALVGLLIAAMALQANAGSLPGKALAMARRLTWRLTTVLAVLLAVLFLGSAILVEMELRQDFARQQVGMEQEAVQLREELERIQSSGFLDELAEPGRLEELRAGFPSLPPDADAEETVTALEQIVLQDLNQLQQVQESHSTAGVREGWGTRLFSQLPDAALAVAAAIVAGVALAGVENGKSPSKDHQPED